MYSFLSPSHERIENRLARQSRQELAYQEIGRTRDGLLGAIPKGFRVNHHRLQLGSGQELFLRARTALLEWRMFELDWVKLIPPETPQEGSDFAILARAGGLWSLNCCRIVYRRDEPQRFAIGFGALPGHAAYGEERIQIDWDRLDDRVHYDLFSFSRPRHPLARLGAPYLRHLQRRFARESAHAMLQAVTKGGDE